ncbi:serine hydrolase domain-containing protein [Salinimicrobium flavum]|uniref:Serine hydrolase domain-containing protein n=1 Tax=Salinimicrobium flavum TaxID=1737065 RepID=A0ABW5IXC9_9FLAO
MKKTIFFVLAAILVLGCQQNKTKLSDSKTVSDSTLKTYFESSSIPAAVMGTIDADGNMTWYHFGPSIWEDSTTVISENNIFRLFSMTKAITSVAALQLVEKGLIGLDDPLNELMPEMVSIPILTKEGDLIKSDQIITLRHLLNNTSGFGNVYFSSRLYNFNPENWDYKDKPRLFEPGTAYAYGTGLDWAGKVIEKLSGQDLETYFRENITGPLKMNDTWFNVPADLSQKIVTFGRRDSLGIINALAHIPEKPDTDYKGAMGLYGSPGDYLKFLNCMLNFGKYEGGQLLKTETAELMFEDSLPKEIKIPAVEQFDNGGIIGFSGEQIDQMKNDRWGYGWYIESDENSDRPVNSVYWGGVNTYYTLDPQNKIALVFFANYFPANDKESYDFYKLYEKEVYSR